MTARPQSRKGRPDVGDVLRPAAIALGLLVGLGSMPGAAQAAAVYNVANLGTLGQITIAQAINDQGQVTGVSFTNDFIPRAFLYDATQPVRLKDLGTLGGTDGWGEGLNEQGTVIGYSSNSSGSQRGFQYNAASGPNPSALGTLGGVSSLALGINDAGTIVGNSTTSGGLSHAFLKPEGGTMRDLGTLGGSTSVATAINHDGLVVGESRISPSNTDTRAFLYNDSLPSGKMKSLGTLGGSFSRANAINDANQVTGFSYLSGNAVQHAFLSTYVTGSTPTMLDLHTLDGDNYSVGLGINDDGQVVGYSGSTTTTVEHAFLYSDGKMVDLNSLIDPVANAGWTLTWATDINNNGQIVGKGLYNGQIRAFLLTPIRLVPEPSSLASLAAGAALAAAGMVRRRRTTR